jgi:hypothetical protein
MCRDNRCDCFNIRLGVDRTREIVADNIGQGLDATDEIVVDSIRHNVDRTCETALLKLCNIKLDTAKGMNGENS